ncbi:hypothetical protein AYI70_g3156 [Smittium culicis]|uniref:Uncharacterized protein n=1 Tax=Smittium culicis TaxID=133412 RepID=A0A1R1Y4Q6_9FUNG|nr:hypothetical protein AYI70_g3156 [Smittium culicis]
MFKSIALLVAVSASLFVSVNSQAPFLKFYAHRNYNVKLRQFTPVLGRCHNIGSFNSAKLLGTSIGFVKMYRGPGCSGSSAIRFLSTQPMLSNSLARYGGRFYSIRYRI